MFFTVRMPHTLMVIKQECLHTTPCYILTRQPYCSTDYLLILFVFIYFDFCLAFSITWNWDWTRHFFTTIYSFVIWTENKYIVFIYLRAIHWFPIFEFISFGILFGSQISYDVMGLPPIFSIRVYWVKYRFVQMSISPWFSVFVLSAICPFGQIYFSHMSIR